MVDLGTKDLETDNLLIRRFCKEYYKQVYENFASDEKPTKYLEWKAHR